MTKERKRPLSSDSSMSGAMLLDETVSDAGLNTKPQKGGKVPKPALPSYPDLDLTGWTLEILDLAEAIDLSSGECEEGDLAYIHPLFSRETFIDITEEEYDIIRRPLKLASALLTAPGTSAFFYNLVFTPREKIPRPVHINTAKVSGKSKKVDSAKDAWTKIEIVRVGPKELKKLDEFWDQLKHSIAITLHHNTLGITDKGGGVYALTYRRTMVEDRPRGPLITGEPSYIAMSHHFLAEIKSLRAGADINCASVTDRPPLPNNQLSWPLILREDYAFAVTLVHELCHASNNARVQDLWEVEPFFGSDRQAECGSAWEQSCHGGVVEGILDAQSDDGTAMIPNLTLGLEFYRWPEPAKWDPHTGLRIPEDENHFVRRLSRRNWETFYALGMGYVQDLVTTRFWEMEVMVKGQPALRMPKVYGMRSLEGVKDWDPKAARSSAGSSADFDVTGSQDGLVVRK